MGGRLYRSRTDRVLGGVAAGLGHYFNIDPTIVRLAWVLLTLWGGAGVVLYIIAWVIVPEHPGGYEAAAAEGYTRPGPGSDGGQDRGGFDVGPGSGNGGAGHGGEGTGRRAAGEFGADGPRRVQSAQDRRTLGWLLLVVGAAVLLFGTPVFSILFSPSVLIGGGLILWGLLTIGRKDRPPRVR